VIFYDPALLVTFTKSIPFWGVLMLNRGGMASHGGIAGVIIACFLLARRARQMGMDVPAFHILDICALVCTPGLGLGRLANFINGELLGRIVAAPGAKGPSWSVQFPQEVLDGHAPPLTPEQEAAMIRVIKTYAPGLPFEEGYARVLHLVQTLPAEKSRALVAELSPLISFRHPSQLYQLFAEGIVLSATLWFLWRVPRKPGFIGCWFLIVYGVLRVVTEFWRLPDADLAVQRFAGLSRGQWLSVAMIAAGTLILRLMVQRSRFDRMGGWGVKTPTQA
jgi:phosphatidylglycerol:prolipoprotein diacylglycerol transferase